MRASLLAAALLAYGQSPPPSLEYKVKAAYLFNFAKYVEWPAVAFSSEDAPLVIGILGQDPLGKLLEETIAGRSVGARRVLVKRSERTQDLRQAHVLFISASERGRLNRIFSDLKESTALTVGEMPGFLEQGMILFVVENNVVRFDINLVPVERAGLKISARMLATARKVYPTNPGRGSR